MFKTGKTTQAAKPASDAYERRKNRARKRSLDESRDGRDIGELPPVARPDVREASRLSFRAFCENYLPQSFRLAWSADHLRIIGRVEQAALRGGLFAYAMPRGSGKTTIAEAAALWVALYGHCPFVAMIGATAKAAGAMLESIRLEIETNGLLQGDFPEVCYPVVRLDGIPQRRLLYHGQRVRMSFLKDRIVLPEIAGSRAAGNVMAVAGITGRIRGWKHKQAGGQAIRPSLVIVDDPQTDESAASPGQCATRERTLAGAVLGLAGPGKKIAGVMPCTVIRQGDVADSLLDRKKHPEWSGERTKMVYSFPTNEKLWEQYAEIRAEHLAIGGDGSPATAFYAEHREAMDVGAEVAWPERFEPGDLSAIQHAMNLRQRDERAFFAEYQNEPLPEIVADSSELTADQIAARVNRSPRATVPAGSTQLTAMIDVQGSALFYAVVAWETAFTGAVIDYGAWPDQQRSYWTLRDAKRTLLTETKAGGLEASIYAGLEALTGAILARDWPTAGGGTQRVARCLIDANWGDSTPVVYRFCRQSVHGAVLLPSHGKGIGASGLPMHDWPKRDGESRGVNWLIRPSHERGLRSVIYDTNFWKSFLSARLAAPMGGKGALTLFGETPARHRMIADHFTSEHRVTTSGRGRQVQEWKLIPGRDNHWWDCAVGACVAASILGQSLEAHGQQGSGKRRRVSMAELRDQANQRKQA